KLGQFQVSAAILRIEFDGLLEIGLGLVPGFLVAFRHAPPQVRNCGLWRDGNGCFRYLGQRREVMKLHRDLRKAALRLQALWVDSRSVPEALLGGRSIAL